MLWIVFQILLVTVVGSVILLVRKLVGKQMNPRVMACVWVLFFGCALFPVCLLKESVPYPSVQKEIRRGNVVEYELWTPHAFDTTRNLLNEKRDEKGLEKGIVLVWGVGVLCSLGWHLAVRCRMHGKIHCEWMKSGRQVLPEKRCREICGEGVQDFLLHGAPEKRNMPVRITDGVGPAVYGFLPAVYIPGALLADGEALRSVLLHEMEHVRRRHAAVMILMEITGSLYWFLPYVNFLFFRCLREDMEYRCDYEVLHRYEIHPKEYALHYVNAAVYGQTVGNGLGFGKGQLKKRVDYMLHTRKHRKYSILALLLVLLILVGGVLGIYLYYRKPDANGHSRAEIAAAREVVIQYVNALENGDREEVLECLADEAELRQSIEYDLEWLRFTVYDLKYAPENVTYYYQYKVMEQYDFEPQNWIFFEMDCDLAMKYESYTVQTGWTLVREQDTGQWEIFQFYMF